ncbi:MAG: AAA family ATPase [Mogibacterium sp.]|nr:AAA family ATPase [Mogibacterium sp.]
MIGPIKTETAEEIYYRTFPQRREIVPGLIPKGLTVLGGGTKIGKSWMMLDLALSVSKGEPFLGKPVEQTGVLYFCLEDSMARMRDRLVELTDDPPDNLYLSTECYRLGEEFTKHLYEILRKYPDVGLIIFDTFQKIREADTGVGKGVYAKDYAELATLKAIADRNNKAVILVHHLRKMPDPNDPFNELSGSAAISGASDTNMVLKYPAGSRTAELYVRGRDVPEKKLLLDFDYPRWTLLEEQDAVAMVREQIPETMYMIRDFVLANGSWSGNATGLLKAIDDSSVATNRLMRMIVRHREQVFAPAGIRADFRKEAGIRRITLTVDRQNHPNDGQ